jgi:hypothetical protein
MIHIVTGSNARYMDKMQPYLRTLNENAKGTRVVLCCVDCDGPADAGSIELPFVPRTALAGSPPESDSLQHGAWLPFVDAADNDVVIWTDGDLFMQRPFSERELADLEAWPAGTFGVSYNMGPHETLLHEALFKLRPKISAGAFLDKWGDVTLQCPCFNVGVMVGRVRDYRKLYDLYMPEWESVLADLEHPARQQWLIGYTMARHFEMRLLPYTFHMHAHFELPSGALVGQAGEAYFNNQLVLFWHVPMWARKHAN